MEESGLLCKDMAWQTAGISFTKRYLGALITGRADKSGSLARTDSSMLTMVSSIRDTRNLVCYRSLGLQKTDRLRGLGFPCHVGSRKK